MALSLPQERKTTSAMERYKNKEPLGNQSNENKEPKKPSKLRRFLYGLSWTIIWPIVVAIPALIIMLVILSQIITSTIKNNPELGGAINTGGIFYFELYILVSVAVLIIILYLVKWLLRTRKHLFFRSGAKVLSVYIWVGIAATGLTMALITKNPDIIKPLTNQDSHLMGVVASVGGDTSKLENVSISYIDSYKEKDMAGEYTPYNDSDGKFSYGTITVKKGLSSEEEKVVVAHEYLHHIWGTQIEPSVIRSLTSQLMTLYGKDDWFKTRLATYSDTNILIPTELFSFYCTESSNQYLTQYVIDQCNTYIKRDTLQFIR